MKSDSSRVHVVAWGPYRPVAGSVLHDLNRVDAAKRGETVLLPLDSDLVDTPLGWSKREFGTSGVSPPFPAPGRICPIVVRVEPGRPFVHWAIELKREEFRSLSGVLRLGADTTIPGTIAPQTGAQGSPIDVRALTWVDRAEELGRFANVTGVLRTSVSIDGLLGLSLYGATTGVFVRRIAVSVCSTEEP